MYIFLELVFLFCIGSMLGWVLELFFRRIVHGKWVNPGFLIGPYLPIYGTGLVALSLMYYFLNDKSLNPAIIILLMGLIMTLIELIGGLIALKDNVRLWDYSNRWMNYKGVICPLFSAIWTLVGAVFYYVLAPFVIKNLEWFSHNLYFSYFIGIFTGVIVIDFCYSTGVYLKIQKFAKDNSIIVKYEQLKMSIKDFQNKEREKYSFIHPFSQTKSLKEYLEVYKEKHNTHKEKLHEYIEKIHNK